MNTSKQTTLTTHIQLRKTSTRSENANVDAVISNICIRIMRLSLLGIRIRIMPLLSAFARLWGNGRFGLLSKFIFKIK
jgi:hypothetical protein